MEVKLSKCKKETRNTEDAEMAKANVEQPLLSQKQPKVNAAKEMWAAAPKAARR